MHVFILDLEISKNWFVCNLNILQQLSNICAKIRNFDEILDEIRDFGRTKMSFWTTYVFLEYLFRSYRLDRQTNKQTNTQMDTTENNTTLAARVC